VTICAVNEMKERIRGIFLDVDGIDAQTGKTPSITRPAAEIFQAVDELETLGELKAELLFSRYNGDVYVTGTARAAFRLECGRCLKDYDFTLSLDIKSAFISAEKAVGDDEVYTYENYEIDVSGFLREQFLLNLPLKQVCNEDCRGLCPGCGKNLNEGDCHCPKKDADSRLAVLKKLKI